MASMTKEEREKQLALLSEQMNRLREQEQQVADAQPATVKKSFSWTKFMINGSYMMFAVVGFLASIEGSPIDMDKYIRFLGDFAVIWAPIVVAYAGGSSFNNYVKAKKEVDLSGTTEPPVQ